MMTTVRELSAKDSARIKCQTMDRERNPCDEPAVVVHQVEWNTGNTTGVSFFYYCEKHHREPIRYGDWQTVNH